MALTRTNGTKRRAARRIGASAVLVLSVAGLAACGDDDSAGPEAGQVTTEDLQALEDRVGALEEDVGALSDGAGVGDDEAAAGQDIIGQEVTISAEVSELITTSDVGSAFRIGADSGPSVAVLATSPPSNLEANDVVQISGTVKLVERDSFEEDFGIAEDDLFDDADTFFGEFEGQPAIAADSVEVLQEQAED